MKINYLSTKNKIRPMKIKRPDMRVNTTRAVERLMNWLIFSKDRKYRK